MSDRLVDSFVRLENEAFITGDGNDKPNGLLRNDDIRTLEIDEEITYETLLQLVGSLHEGYLENASFLMNRATLSIIQSLKDETRKIHLATIYRRPIKSNYFWPACCRELSYASLLVQVMQLLHLVILKLHIRLWIDQR